MADDYKKAISKMKIMCFQNPDNLFLRYNYSLAMMKIADQ